MKEITYEDIAKANEVLKSLEVKGTRYIEVNQRIKAFRMVYPTGYIHTHFFDLKDGVCVMLAEVGYYDENNNRIMLATGTAYEKEGSTFINKTSYIENCETSAVGRALGMCGFGIDTSVASYEEVQNAIANQEKIEKKASPKQVETLKKVYTGENRVKLLEANNINTIEELSMEKASELISSIRQLEKVKEAQ